jgi:hypothetical protein
MSTMNAKTTAPANVPPITSNGRGSMEIPRFAIVEAINIHRIPPGHGSAGVRREPLHEYTQFTVQKIRRETLYLATMLREVPSKGWGVRK